MNRALHIIFAFFLFIIVLEIGSKIHMDSLGYHHLKSLKESNTPVRYWKNLPYKLRQRDGRITRIWKNGNIVLDVPFKIDPGTRRVSYPLLKDAQEYLVFIGCSFTFGAGVSDTETLPSQYQKLSDYFRVYNYGVGGASPEEVLYRLQNISSDELKEKAGRVVYSYFAGHLSRHFYHPNFVARWGYQKLVYRKIDGKVTSLGSYEQVYPYRTYWYRLRWKSYFYQLFSQAFPDYLSEKEIKKFAEFLGTMSKESIRLSGKKLIVVIWPNSIRPQ